MINPFISIENLSIGYDNTVCEAISAKVQKGELVGLIGKNGSGKSTLIKTLLGLQKHKNGSVFYQEEDISRWTENRRAQRIAVVFSRLKFVPAISVLEMIYLGRLPHKKWMLSPSLTEIKQIEEVLELVGIIHLKDKLANQLSDGQLQMVMIARALLQETDLIVMDEPTSHLDLENQFKIFEIIDKLSQQTSKTFIVATHQVELILQKATQIWWIDQGRFYAGFPEQIAYQCDILKSFEQEKIHFDYELGKFKFQTLTTQTVSFMSDYSELAYWVKHALKRNGFSLEPTSIHQIQIQDSSILLNEQKVESIEELIQTLKQNQ